MSQPFLAVLVLAAGKGTRMQSFLPKVMQPLLGKPMLGYVYKAIEDFGVADVFTVVGHKAKLLGEAFPQHREKFFLQEEQLGTGHALQVAWPALKEAGLNTLLVVNGDTPLLQPWYMERLFDYFKKSGSALCFLSMEMENTGCFGRVVRDEHGEVTAIVEAKDYTGPSGGGEINTGIYALNMEVVGELLPRLTNKNAGGEYYITDLVGEAAQAGFQVSGLCLEYDPGLMGVNSSLELAQAEEYLQKSIVEKHLQAGVSLHQAGQIVIGPDVVIHPGADITGPCHILGTTTIAAGAVTGPYVFIKDSIIGEDAAVYAFCHLEGACVGKRCQVGPYARLRPLAVMEERARVGNFVEMKKSTLGAGAKAGHLTYLGDTTVGCDVNIGAGTITCNYDGENKHNTCIEEKAFIGSNTALVAPVHIGAGSLIGAGSVITRDVPSNTLALTRSTQRIILKK